MRRSRCGCGARLTARHSGAQPALTSTAPRARGFADVLATAREIAGNHIVVSMTLVAGTTSLLVGNAYQAQMPEFAADLGHGDVGVYYSMLLAANAAGALTAGIMLETWGLMQGRPRLAFMLVILWCLCIRGFAVSRIYLLSSLLLFVAGFLNLAFSTMSQTLVQLHAPNAIRGRVLGLYNMASNGMRAFSGVTVGMARKPGRRPLVAGPERAGAARGHARPVRFRSSALRRAAGRVKLLPPLPKSGKVASIHYHPPACHLREFRMFSKINHVAIVSENYAQLAQFYQAVFGMTTSDKTRPGRAVTVRDGYVGLNINPRRAGRSAGLDHFGIQVEDCETVFDRMRKKYPTVKWLKRPVDPPVRRHHHPRSRRQHVRHLAEGHDEPHVGLCRERRQDQCRATSITWRCAR